MLNISSIYKYIADSKGHIRLSPIRVQLHLYTMGANPDKLILKSVNIDIISFNLTNGGICLESCPFCRFSTFLSMLARGLVEIYTLLPLCDKTFH